MNHVLPKDLGHVWEFVAHGLSRIQRRVGETNWTQEQVKNCLLGGKAGLFICPEGFVILEPDHEPLSMKPFLNVWLAWFQPTKAKAMRETLVHWLDAQALQTVGTTDWRFTSPRRGWAGIEPDCEVHMITWRRKAK